MYLESVASNFKSIGFILAFVWGVVFISMAIDMRRFRNSFFLLIALIVSLFGIAALFGPYMERALMWIVVLITLILFSVPALLVANGIIMLKREGRSLANILSLLFGLLIGAGEFLTIYSMIAPYDYQGLGLSGVIRFSEVFSVSVIYVCLIFLSFMFYCILIQWVPHFLTFDYVIVLGCGLLHGDQMSRLLSNRCDKGIEVYKKGKGHPILICSGGQGGDETIPEAAAMKKYMMEKGIPEDHIIAEDQSMTTMENLINSKKIIDAREGGKKTVIVTGNYHVYRALSYSRKLKFKCSGVGAKVAGYYWPSALIREFAAVMKERRHMILFLIVYLIIIIPMLAY